MFLSPTCLRPTMGVTTWQVYRKVILPAVLPSVLAGMRLEIIFCLLGFLVASGAVPPGSRQPVRWASRSRG